MRREALVPILSCNVWFRLCLFKNRIVDDRLINRGIFDHRLLDGGLRGFLFNWPGGRNCFGGEWRWRFERCFLADRSRRRRRGRGSQLHTDASRYLIHGPPEVRI
jgi:hypothetical protein